MTTEQPTETTNFEERIDHEGPLTPVVQELCTEYSVGEPICYSTIHTGYEDYNVYVKTQEGEYVAKMFSKDREPHEITRYTETMRRVLNAGVNHPQLHRTHSGEYVCKTGNISMVLMDFIDGDNYMELGRTPSQEELESIIEQAAKVNRIDYKPPFLFDSWAIPNIDKLYESVRQYISPVDRALVEYVIAGYHEIPVDTLPHCFVHGDFTKANVLKGNNGKQYILDFSVSNYYPRIQELAVIAANLLHNETLHTSLRDRTDLVASIYDRYNKLTPEEKRSLYSYALTGVAMEFLGGCKEKFLNKDASEETNFWIALGRQGLQKEIRGY